MDIEYFYLRRLALLYAVLPLAIFLVFWLRFSLSLLGVFCLIVTVFAMREGGGDSAFVSPAEMMCSGERGSGTDGDGCLHVGIHALIALALIAILWCVLGGQGGFWYQSPDWGIRNAIFRDLITHPWPVFYNDGGAALCYYFGFWLPTAGLGRLLLLAGAPMDVVWALSNVLLLLWTASGVMLVFLLMIDVLGIREDKLVIAASLFLVFFSTPDILGLLVSGKWGDAIRAVHLEWWATGVAQVGQISSITTCLFWVFNQAVIPWICTLLFLGEKNFSRYLLIFAAAFFSGPMPGVGLAALMVAQGIGVIIPACRADAHGPHPLRSVLSAWNGAGLLFACIAALFFSANSAVSNTAAMQTSVQNALSYPLWFPHNKRLAVLALAFVVIEGLLIPLLCYRDFKRVPVFWGVITTLVLCPFIRIGGGADFCMRSSIPAVLMMCLFAFRSLWLHPFWGRGLPADVVAVALAVVLALGAITPAFEIGRGFVACFGVLDDTLYDRYEGESLEGMDFSALNFGFDNPGEDAFFRLVGKMPQQ